jgi:hypothetical protein
VVKRGAESGVLRGRIVIYRLVRVDPIDTLVPALVEGVRGLPYFSESQVGELATGDRRERVVAYLTGPSSSVFSRPENYPALVELVATGLPAPVFTELSDLLQTWPETSGLDVLGPLAVAGFAAGPVRDGDLTWDDVVEWVRTDVATTRELIVGDELRDLMPVLAGSAPPLTWRQRPREEHPIRRLWLEWGRTTRLMGPAAPSWSLWHAAGFTPKDVLDAWQSGQAPDAAALAAMASSHQAPASEQRQATADPGV